jgi:hypothetical protein
MDSQTTGNMPGSSSFESAFSTLGDRLKTIENVLHSHTDQLIWIGNQVGSLTAKTAYYLLFRKVMWISN